ncbi:hypothetical protein FNV43_RR06500 [Rhamnella rubrinervis]|uniref:Uncharacterized protein n=1 Tax=Rhamnella rubrinervis TaxID=2594499 RepID=A0A8K0HEN7_9ROSA|nr:hypothetical protein FNV43_RR06500 [Rhamnella rubrinervis]
MQGPEEELAPRFEFFLTSCSSTTKSDPEDSIVGASPGTLLHASTITSWGLFELGKEKARPGEGVIITWFGEGLAWTSKPGNGPIVMARNKFPWLECGKSLEVPKGKFAQ